MKRVNYWLRSTFGFSKMEANGIMILLPLMGLIISSPYLYQHIIYSMTLSDYNTPVISKLHLELKKHEKEDSIKNRQKWQDSFYALEKKSWTKNNSAKPRKFIAKPKHTIQPFDLNIADTTQLKRVKGIGKVLSSRIVKYRNLLGGFVSLTQLKEVYGLKDSVLFSLDTLVFISDEYRPSLVQINLASEYALKKHPYINALEAKAISNYRFQHGAYSKIEDLYHIKTLDSARLTRLKPYLDFQMDSTIQR